MTRRHFWRIAAVASLALLAGAFLWLWPRAPAVDPTVARVQQLQQNMANVSAGPADPAGQVAAFRDLRRELDALTPEQREKIMFGPGNPLRERMRRDVDGYFELPADKRTSYLDQKIAEQEQFRQAMQQSGLGPPGSGGPGSNAAGGGSGPPGGFGGRSPEQRHDRLLGMLDNTTPKERAKFSEYMRAVRARRTERGLPNLGPGR